MGFSEFDDFVILIVEFMCGCFCVEHHNGDPCIGE